MITAGAPAESGSSDPRVIGSDVDQLLCPDREVDKLAHRIFVFDHHVEIRDESVRICKLVGVITPTVEGDRNLTILDFADVVDGRGSELKHNEKEKSKGSCGVFYGGAAVPLVIIMTHADEIHN